ncbi:flagellar protein FlaG [Clostridium frigidicarnis]|uniref:Flagellar protein FlaG n=1 Tax=Clostridium frigidicarnis TaxID=84698 RepID=A0A1I0VDS6_9CLOT|nr:flagellar protein FlaG [Clostridium frigidicarnis]SFA74422.1 flagellar protein FlaG [Clostridium frigidicarnis]
MEVTKLGQGRQEMSNNVEKVVSYSNTKDDNEALGLKDNELKKEDLDKAMNKLNKFWDDENIKVEYNTHEKFRNSIIIKITNKETHEVLMEVPPKKILDMVAKMCEMVGVLIDKKA